jgi:hypothetical protein
MLWREAVGEKEEVGEERAVRELVVRELIVSPGSNKINVASSQREERPRFHRNRSISRRILRGSVQGELDEACGLSRLSSLRFILRSVGTCVIVVRVAGLGKTLCD